MIDFQREVTSDGIVIVRLEGWLEEISCPYFSGCMRDLLDDGFDQIVVDCSNLGLIRSSCLGNLIRSNKRVKQRDGSITLANVNSALLEVLGFLGLTKLFGIYPSVEAAVTRARKCRQVKDNQSQRSYRGLRVGGSKCLRLCDYESWGFSILSYVNGQRGSQAGSLRHFIVS